MPARYGLKTNTNPSNTQDLPSCFSVARRFRAPEIGVSNIARKAEARGLSIPRASVQEPLPARLKTRGNPTDHVTKG